MVYRRWNASPPFPTLTHDKVGDALWAQARGIGLLVYDTTGVTLFGKRVTNRRLPNVAGMDFDTCYNRGGTVGPKPL